MYAIVDIETTGGNCKTGKITEIAIIRHDGNRVLEVWDSLINPQRSIPQYVSMLTGITDQMVAEAPEFYQVAKKIVELTQDAIFVAHNAAFDYSFVQAEFETLGYVFERPTLCTVKMSRKLLPGHQSYSLGNLTSDLGIDIQNRHRANGDALATVKLFEMLLDKNGGLFAHEDPHRLFSTKGLHPGLLWSDLKALPEKTGVYSLHNESGGVHYVGKSNNIRQRVLTHLAAPKGKKALEMQQKSAGVSFEVTGSELVALLLETDGIKTLKPQFNRAQRRAGKLVGIYAYHDQNGYWRLAVRAVDSYSEALVAFDTVAEAKNTLFQWVEKYNLCQQLCGLYDGTAGCFQYQIQQCKGACRGEEPVETYNLRVHQCVQAQEFDFQNAVLLDWGRDAEEYSFVWIEKGRYLGVGFVPVAESVQHVAALKSYLQPKTETRDARMIVTRFLKNKKVLKVIRW